MTIATQQKSISLDHLRSVSGSDPPTQSTQSCAKRLLTVVCQVRLLRGPWRIISSTRAHEQRLLVGRSYYENLGLRHWQLLSPLRICRHFKAYCMKRGSTTLNENSCGAWATTTMHDVCYDIWFMLLHTLHLDGMEFRRRLESIPDMNTHTMYIFCLLVFLLCRLGFDLSLWYLTIFAHTMCDMISLRAS